MDDGVWELRGRARPDAAILERLRGMHPHWCVAWQPGDEALQGRWIVYVAKQADPLWRSAGLARLRRFMLHATKETAGIRWATEAMIAGLHFVAEFTDEQFGTDYMWRQLRDTLDFEKANREAVEKALERQMAGDVVEEADHTPEFRALVDQTVEEWWPRFGKDARSVFISKGLRAPSEAAA